MTKRILTILFSLIIIAQTFSPTQAKAEGPDIPCSSYILIDLDNGRVLAEKNADKKVYPASTTKIMTSIVALERSKLDKVMTASRAAVYEIGVGGQNIGIMEGEQMVFSDLIKAVLLNSANEGANIIAENSAPSRQDFINLMNEKAKKIGATHTHYVNCHGMYDPNHYTTARDLATIARYAMVLSPASKTFRSVVSSSSYTLPPTNKHSVWYGLKITNKLRDYKSEYFNKVLGVKTGYTTASGNNFIGCVQNYQGKRLLSVITGVHSIGTTSDKFFYTKKLMEYGYINNSLMTVSKSGEVAKSFPVNNQPGGINSVNLLISSDVKIFLPKEYTLTQKIVDSKESLSAPIPAGTKVATLNYYSNGLKVSSMPLITEKDVPLSYESIRTTITMSYLGFILLLFVLIYYLNRSTKPKRNK